MRKSSIWNNRESLRTPACAAPPDRCSLDRLPTQPLCRGAMPRQCTRRKGRASNGWIVEQRAGQYPCAPKSRLIRHNLRVADDYRIDGSILAQLFSARSGRSLALVMKCKLDLAHSGEAPELKFPAWRSPIQASGTPIMRQLDDRRYAIDRERYRLAYPPIGFFVRQGGPYGTGDNLRNSSKVLSRVRTN